MYIYASMPEKIALFSDAKGNPQNFISRNSFFYLSLAIIVIVNGLFITYNYFAKTAKNEASEKILVGLPDHRHSVGHCCSQQKQPDRRRHQWQNCSFLAHEGHDVRSCQNCQRWRVHWRLVQVSVQCWNHCFFHLWFKATHCCGCSSIHACLQQDSR